jgi:hypothetical protein
VNQGPRLEGMDLDEDLCELLWADMNLGTGAMADVVNEPATITELFERWSARNASSASRGLSSTNRISMPDGVVIIRPFLKAG